MSDITVKEWVSGPGAYQDKTYSVAELRELFEPGSLVCALLDELDRLQRELAERGSCDAPDIQESTLRRWGLFDVYVQLNEARQSLQSAQAAAYEHGWRAAVSWCNGDYDDLIFDIGSPAYIKQRDAALTAQPASEPDEEETPCAVREDGAHCNCWYEGKPCCSCGHGAILNGQAWPTCAEVHAAHPASDPPISTSTKETKE